jgi:hypothetical protein
MTSALAERLEQARTLCLEALQEPALQAISVANSGRLPNDENCYSLLETVSVDSSSSAWLEDYRVPGMSAVGALERWLLLRAALAAMPRIRDWPVGEEVKVRWAEEAEFFARPPAVWASAFSLKTTRFCEMARVATLRRFPAGQFHWELSGWPRSFLLRSPPSSWPRLVGYVARAGGFRPFAETHVNARRKNRLTLTEAEGLRSYYLLARSLAFQPRIKGLITGSWLYCPTTAEFAPHLAWLRQFFLQHGAAIASIGHAPANSGFLVGSDERRKLYEEGRYRPTMTYVIWLRSDILRWSREFERTQGA